MFLSMTLLLLALNGARVDPLRVEFWIGRMVKLWLIIIKVVTSIKGEMSNMGSFTRNCCSGAS